MRFFGLLAVLITGALLLVATSDLPSWGDPQSPSNDSGVARHYITKIDEETHVPNLVTAVLADYRGYDTLFETVVIFTAGIAIMAILRGLPAPLRTRNEEMDDDIIRITCRLLTPIIQVFALYVLAHGHYSPGGGFQGGVIMGSSFILLALAYDLRTALHRFSEGKFIIVGALGIILYGGFGIASMILEGNFLEYRALDSILPGDPIMARYHSMLGVEIGVMLTVSAIMFAIYANLSTRGAFEKGL